MLPAAEPVIMIVDDFEMNLNLLGKQLTNCGYGVRLFLGGELALTAAREDPPHLILLDITMPVMNGFEVCEQLKADARTRDIPVIFMSALDDTMDKIRAFQCGGVDYVTKPFEFEEINARVRTHLTIHALQRELEHQNQHLEELVQERTQQLTDACDRLAILDDAKTEFLNLISHELRTPLTGVFGIADMLFEQGEADPNRQRLWNAFDSARQNLRAILDDALLLTEIDVSPESETIQTTALREILAAAAAAIPDSCGISFAERPLDNQIVVVGTPGLLTKAFVALVQTAAKFAVTPHPVRMTVTQVESQVQIGIHAQGRTIPEEFLESFFDVFAVTRTIFPGGNLGLGPPVAKRIISLAGGSVRVQNESPQGISFLVQLQIARQDGP